MNIQEATDYLKAQIIIMNYSIGKDDTCMNLLKESMIVVSDYVIQNERVKAIEFIKNKLKLEV